MISFQSVKLIFREDYIRVQDDYRVEISLKDGKASISSSFLPLSLQTMMIEYPNEDFPKVEIPLTDIEASYEYEVEINCVIISRLNGIVGRCSDKTRVGFSLYDSPEVISSEGKLIGKLTLGVQWVSIGPSNLSKNESNNTSQTKNVSKGDQRERVNSQEKEKGKFSWLCCSSSRQQPVKPPLETYKKANQLIVYKEAEFEGAPSIYREPLRVQFYSQK